MNDRFTEAVRHISPGIRVTWTPGNTSLPYAMPWLGE
jgi:hypothetical protein